MATAVGDGAGVNPVSGGWCHRCGTVHTLPLEPVRRDCLELMEQLQRMRRIDGRVPDSLADPRCSTDALFGAAGGKMFGMLSCRDAAGRRVVLRAFSGQYNGLWQVDGWTGPVMDVAAFTELVREPERAIKRLGRELHASAPDADQHRELRNRRRDLSRHLMHQIHNLYQLVNFRGEQVPLTEVFIGSGGPPAGTADCCGPKLLHHAALHGLRPEGLAEFYWGRSNGSGSKVHGRFYPACATKCQPILGFLLCGLQ
jgi:hypothetical protein